VGADCQAACLVDGPTDDYEWYRKFLEEFHEDKPILYVHGSWIFKVEMSLTSYLAGTRPKPLVLKAVKHWY
jgi:hypothetical protein